MLLLLAAAAPGASASEEPRGATPPAAAASGFDPARLGMSEAELRRLFGPALAPVSVEPVRSVHEQILEASPSPQGAGAGADAEPFAEQRRLGRAVAPGDVRQAEYDLFRGRVYRLRWLLAERFERPFMSALVAHLSERLGPPAYDQRLAAKLGSGKAELRRAGWHRGGLALELRQLHPFTGGPLYLTLADLAAMQAIVEARGVVMPQPETTGDWWRRPQSPPELPTHTERDALLAAIDALVAGTGFATER